MILIASLRTALDFISFPSLHHPSALQALSSASVPIFSSQNPTLQSVRTKIALWYTLVGHVATSDLPHIAKITIIPEIFKTAISGAFPSPAIFEPCLEGKQTQLLYPPSENSATFPLDVIHIDSCHDPVPSLEDTKILSL